MRILASHCAWRRALVGAGLLLAGAVAAAEPPASERFLGVKGWTGTFTMTTPTQQGAGWSGNNRNTWRLEASSHGTVRVDRLVGVSRHSLRWEGSGEVTLSVDLENRWDNGRCRSVWVTQGTYPGARDAHGEPLRSRVHIRRGEGTYDFNFVRSSVGVERRSQTNCDGTITRSTRTNAESFYYSARDLPLPAAGLTLSGSRKLKEHPSPLWPLTYQGAHSLREYDVEITWHLVPVTEEVELVVALDGYEAWRPQAGSDERTSGNALEVRARLLRPDGGATDVKAGRITFELAGTSREPGVAMNYPPAGSARDDLDLQFVPSPELDACAASGDGLQRCETPPGERASASARIASFDWGGWSTLKVTAELQDGRRLVGHLQGAPGTTEVRLPRRAAGSKVADAWKEGAGLSLPDDDDSEGDPAGDGRNGDGLALYQEYRGFIENGKHVEGHPRRKDYFLQNRIGADAELGIQLFADLTGLLVHKDLLRPEMGDDRLIAFNSSQGERVGFGDQHGVILVTDPDIDGANAWSANGSGPGPPGNTEVVRVQPRDKASSVLTSPFELRATDQLIAYDRAIVHELMHTVSVWHHGEEDYVLQVHLQFPGGAAFPVDRPTFFELEGNPLAGLRHVTRRIVHEESGEDYAAVYAGYLWWAPPDLRVDGVYPFMVELQLGAKHGRHSGNQDCVMRYAFAKVYPADVPGAGPGSAELFYWHDEEPIGLDLCDSPAGTGVNAPGRRPQPRYFDAAPGRGACRRQINVNDSLPVIVR